MTTRRRAIGAVLVFLLLAGAVAVAGVWLLFFSGSPPQAASLDDADDALASVAPGAAAGDPSGTWLVDTTIGSFSDYSSTYAGFRVNEVLQGIGETTAIGRTPGVSGQLTIGGGSLTEATIEVDLTSITSDRSRRDPAIQRTLETGSFPTATFSLTEPIDLADSATDGATYSFAANGTMSIHGVTQPVVANLEARLVNGVIVVVGTTEFSFSDYGMSAPTAPIVLSVEDSGLIEFQLFFSRPSQ